MSEEGNKATIRRVFEEVFNKGNLAIIPELISPDYIYHSPFGDFKGVEGFKQFVTMTRQAFPDVKMKIDDMLAEGDKLAVRLSWGGTFKGKFGDIEPTGHNINMTAAYFYRYKNGKEVEAIPFTDMLSLYQQMGVTLPKS